ncbi:hypothetical protein BDV18DRAFT_3454 [Aspergillus unguis]
MQVISTLIPFALVVAVAMAAPTPGTQEVNAESWTLGEAWTLDSTGEGHTLPDGSIEFPDGTIIGAHGGPAPIHGGNGPEANRVTARADEMNVEDRIVHTCMYAWECNPPHTFCVEGFCRPGSLFGGDDISGPAPKPSFPPGGATCISHLACGVGSFCVDGKCTVSRTEVDAPECTTHPDCGPGSFCMHNKCTVARENESDGKERRQGPIETHVPFPPGSGGDYGHGHA